MDLKDRKKSWKSSGYVSSFRYAFRGVVTAFQEERNMRTHVILGGIVLLACLFLGLSIHEWLWIILSIFLVIVMEIWNTVIENITDFVTQKKRHPLAKKIKDMAAAAVLITTGFAVIVALIIILPKIWAILF